LALFFPVYLKRATLYYMATFSNVPPKYQTMRLIDPSEKLWSLQSFYILTVLWPNAPEVHGVTANL